jgi:ABC-type lipoprotein release transport system permease subunit
MRVVRLILKEALHRKLNSLLSLLAVLVTVALFVAFFTTAEAARRETVRVTRDLGFNLRIIPKETDMDRFWATGFSEQTMPEEAARRLASYDQVFFSYNHLVATLQQRFILAGKEVVLTGVAPTITAPDQKKQPMGFQIKPGTVHVGFQIAQRLGLKKDGMLELAGRKFTVERCLVESGTEEDIHVYGTLADIQKVLNLEGRINEIKAIDCLCLTADQDPLKVLRAELEKVLPEAKVIQLRAMADARAKQRQTVEKYFGFLTPLLLMACGLWVGVLAVLNVRERKVEIGVLRALGHGSGWIAGLFLGKAALVGLVGAALGYGVGTILALEIGPDIFKVTAKAIRPNAPLLGWSLAAALVLTTLASFIPAMLAVTLDPAETLRET